MKKVLSITIALLVCFLLVTAFNTDEASAQETYEWLWQISAPAGTPYMTCAENMAERVEKATGGRLQIKVEAGGSIVPSHDVTDAVQGGVLDCASPNPSMDLGRFGPKVLLLGASGFPGGPSATEFLAWAYKGDGLKYAQQIYGSYGCEAIGWVTAAPPELFCHAKEDLSDLEDFKGVKFRTMGLWGDILEGLGASVVTLSGSEIYQAMDRGVVDAFEYCGPGVDWDTGFQEIAKYIGVPGIHSPLSSNVFIVNSQVWEELPEDLQETVKHEVRAASLLDYIEFGWGDAIGFQNFEEYGNEIFEVSEEAQQEIAKRSYNQCLEYAGEDKLFEEIFENQMEFITNWKAIMDKQRTDSSIFDYYGE